MIKDIITKERIKQDYQKQFFGSTKVVIVMPIILILLIALIVFLFSLLEFNAMLLAMEILFLFPAVFVCYLCIATLIEANKDLDTIKKDSFRIETDILIGSEEKATYITSAFAASFNHPYILEFKSFGKYCVPKENYSASKIYDMSDKGVFNYSNVGDTFYLILDAKDRILSVYNTKMFELAD